MRYLKKFEAFDLGRFAETEEEENKWMEETNPLEDEDCETCGDDIIDDYEDEYEDEYDEEGNDIEMRRKVWGDEIVEGLTKKQKKLPKALQDAILKKKGKKEDNKKEYNKKEDNKGLTAAQKKLPKALQDAILKKQK
jgi:hypothetical protein